MRIDALQRQDEIITRSENLNKNIDNFDRKHIEPIREYVRNLSELKDKIILIREYRKAGYTPEQIIEIIKRGETHGTRT